jgi:mRNA interferase RelE/StbE
VSASRWRIEFDRDAAKELRKLGEPARRENPRRFGKPLAGEFAGLWRYRVGDYRLVVTFEDDRLIVLVLRVAHRREVYD